MAQMTKEELNNYLNGNGQRRSSENQNNNITFFQLADGQQAFIRFMHDSRDDFEVLTMHEIPVGNTVRKISCLGNGCPVCGSNIKFTDRFHNEKTSNALTTKIYVRLIEYVRQADGSVTAVPRIWERPIGFARELANYLDTYGPLSNIVMQISRIGSGTSTTYQVMYLPQDRFPENVFVKDVPGIREYRALGGFVMNKTAAEIDTYLATGQFPSRNGNTAPVQAHEEAPVAKDATENIFNLPEDKDYIEWSVEQPKQAEPQQPKQEPKQQMPWEVNTTAAPQTTAQAQQQKPLPWEVNTAPPKPARYY